MVLLLQCVVCCALFTLMILPAQYRDPLKMIMSYPPEVIRRVEELAQYRDTIKGRQKAHVSKKIGGLVFFVFLLAAVAALSGCRTFGQTFKHVFTLFLTVNLYDLIVLDWCVFCHSRKLRIPGTEDMDAAYRDRVFHVRGFRTGLILGTAVAFFAALLVYLVI